MVRNTLKHVAKKDMKAFAKDLKTIYLSADEKSGYENMQAVWDIRDSKYPNAMKRWEDDQNVISPIFKFSEKVRRIIYTANAVESLNSTYKKLNCQRSVFPNTTALLKSLYLSTLQARKKWTVPLINGGQAYGEFSIMYPDRMPESF